MCTIFTKQLRTFDPRKVWKASLSLFGLNIYFSRAELIKKICNILKQNLKPNDIYDY